MPLGQVAQARMESAYRFECSLHLVVALLVADPEIDRLAHHRCDAFPARVGELAQRTQLTVRELHLHASHVRILLHCLPHCHHYLVVDSTSLHREHMRMLLAEALAARKDVMKEIDELSRRLTAAVVRYEDEAAPVDDPAQVGRELERALDRLEQLSIQINLANNQTRLAFDGRELTLMEAVALRERLVLESKARHAAVHAIEQAVGGGRSGRGWLAGRRAKDDLREVANVDLAAERRGANRLSETVRRLDMAMQQRNWTTDITI